MNTHPAFNEGNVAVITGAADGIGLAAAKKYYAMRLRVCMADIDAEKLGAAATAIGDVLAVPVDVSDRSQLESLREKVYAEHDQHPTSALAEADVLVRVDVVGRFGAAGIARAGNSELVPRRQAELVRRRVHPRGLLIQVPHAVPP